MQRQRVTQHTSRVNGRGTTINRLNNSIKTCSYWVWHLLLYATNTCVAMRFAYWRPTDCGLHALYETRAMRVTSGQAKAYVGDNTYYRYSVDSRAGTAHFSAIMPHKQFNNKFGNNTGNTAQSHIAVRALQINAQQLQRFRSMSPAEQAVFMRTNPLPVRSG